MQLATDLFLIILSENKRFLRFNHHNYVVSICVPLNANTYVFLFADAAGQLKHLIISPCLSVFIKNEMYLIT